MFPHNITVWAACRQKRPEDIIEAKVWRRNESEPGGRNRDRKEGLGERRQLSIRVSVRVPVSESKCTQHDWPRLHWLGWEVDQQEATQTQDKIHMGGQLTFDNTSCMYILCCTRNILLGCTRPAVLSILFVNLSNDNLVSLDDCIATVSNNLVNCHALS